MPTGGSGAVAGEARSEASTLRVGQAHEAVVFAQKMDQLAELWAGEARALLDLFCDVVERGALSRS
jgi:hypothetical protein